MAFNNDRADGKACDTCENEDTGSSEYPCNGCDVYKLDKWSPKSNGENDDIW